MVVLIGASCLRNALDAVLKQGRRSITVPYCAVGGLSLNPFAKNKYQNLQYLLHKGKLSSAQNIVLWHGVLSNSISAHRTNDFCPLPVEDLIKCLKEHKERFTAIVYCRRLGSPDLFNQLKETGILILDVKRNLISKKKRRNPLILREFSQVHPKTKLEINVLFTVLNHLQNLRFLTKKHRSKSKSKTPAKKQKEKNRKKNQKKLKKMKLSTTR